MVTLLYDPFPESLFILEQQLEALEVKLDALIRLQQQSMTDLPNAHRRVLEDRVGVSSPERNSLEWNP